MNEMYEMHACMYDSSLAMKTMNENEGMIKKNFRISLMTSSIILTSYVTGIRIKEHSKNGEQES